jgi:hypothetical protein
MVLDLRKETGDERWKAPTEKSYTSVLHMIRSSVYRPMQLLALEPMCMNLCIFSAILLGILYLFFGAFQLVFSHVYEFNLWQIGCSFLGILVGMVSAILTDPLWRRNYARLERQHQEAVGEKTESMPEWRLPPGKCLKSVVITIRTNKFRYEAIGGAPLVTIGLFIFAWTIYPHVHWVVPIIGSAVFGAGYIV